MGSLVNSETNKDVNAFIDAIPNKVRQTDSRAVLAMMKEITRCEPKIWGRSIVGFGKYSYKRKDGSEHEWFNVGFSPAKAHLSLYFMFDLQAAPLLEKLGPHKKGRGCLYVKRLEQIDLEVLKELIAKSDRW